jgi:hypothetical protein
MVTRMKFTTDKLDLGYFPYYLRIAAELGPAARVCEIGVWHGEGLDMFQALFPYGVLAGVDANPGSFWPPGTHQVIAAQDDPALPEILDVYSPEWDLISEDASHNGILTTATFGLLWPRVAPGGFYVIEDWEVGLDLPQWAHFGNSMLLAAQGLLPLLTRDGDVEDITYRCGLAILRKKQR